MPSVCFRGFAERASAIALCFWVCELLSSRIDGCADQAAPGAARLLGVPGGAHCDRGSLVLVPHLGTVAIFAITTVVAFSLAPLYPLAVSFLRANREHPGVGKVFACASLGGTYCPGSPACSDPLPQSADWLRRSRDWRCPHAAALALLARQ